MLTIYTFFLFFYTIFGLCLLYIDFLFSYIIHFYYFLYIYYIVQPFSIKIKCVQYIQTILLKCGQIFSLPQSIYKTEVSRVKVNRTNNNWNRFINTEQSLKNFPVTIYNIRRTYELAINIWINLHEGRKHDLIRQVISLSHIFYNVRKQFSWDKRFKS